MSEEVKEDILMVKCFTCGEEVPYLASVARLGKHFCTMLCRDIFDERNDYGHERGRRK